MTFRDIPSQTKEALSVILFAILAIAVVVAIFLSGQDGVFNGLSPRSDRSIDPSSTALNDLGRR